MTQTSSRIYKIYVSLVATILIGGSVYSSIAQQDYFPFAAFMMYSGTQKTQDLYMLKSFCHKNDGTVTAVSDFDTWAQEIDYFEYIDRRAPLPWSEMSMNECKNAIRSLLKDLSNRGCTKITLYRYYWKHFAGPQALTPDNKDLVCEVGAIDGH